MFTNRCWVGFIDNVFDQCSGSVTFWYGSESADPYLLLIDPDLDPDPDPALALFVSDLQDTNKNIFSS
jgi:hypothetical protein